MQIHSLAIVLVIFAAVLIQASPLPNQAHDDILIHESAVSVASSAKAAVNLAKKRRSDDSSAKVDARALAASNSQARVVSPAGILDKDIKDPLDGKRGPIGEKIHEDIEDGEKALKGN
ncbi:hypothetical protein J3Q64DRAFT_1844459 [Phycomyces blakesleeanus]|uniref:Uncharacterized protein n=2 Tax=Phycomyces blakesleeanus TaxID=4837 RepID=A0A162WKT1_PHYB8|nr:hypothetical protein PHYBLDRAFT_183152 [Phycomyces blakesleeanus NRRL 1555(-)]OAD68675.1 hypothetical protein PHYBLDRAFT_183152 [Phycomyces blakesleeanus NRRL 1555(-)]|eukprot:XP_018286715.1 hypothetical protein PHYBLDRAFT_183152 [Phycomyces blakesleeanus NRRL 1555(-)]